jgi:hypothetical protein
MRMEAWLKEAIDRCDRWIDPLREIMFDIIVADMVFGKYAECIVAQRKT